jgi:hypothetical protein
VLGGEGEGGRAAAAPRRWEKERAAELLRALGEGGAEDREPGARSGGGTNHDVEPGEERDADVNIYASGGDIYITGTPTPRLRQAGHDYTVDPS